MQSQKIVSKSEWLAARLELLEKEKAFNRMRDELSAERQRMPWTRVAKNYMFQSVDGDVSLADAFGIHSQLIVYHFMFDPDWHEGCVSCSFWADNFNGIIGHLAARDVALVAISNASLAQLAAYKARLGWSFEWLSAGQNDFGNDFHVSFENKSGQSREVYYNYRMQALSGTEMPGISVFFKDEQGAIFHTYSTYSRGLDMLNAAYHYLDLVPKGRDESSLPWSMAWLSRNDEYA